MLYRTIVGLFILLFVCSCLQNAKKKVPLMHSGLTIENGINRGIDYTDSLGANFSIRYIPITITNDSTIQIHLQIEFLKKYNYPHSNKDLFKLIPLPKEWALDGVGVTESMIDKLPKYIDRPIVQVTIEPGEKKMLSIASIYPNPAKTTGVLPRTLFAQCTTTTYPECDWPGEVDGSINQQIPLGLKIIFGERCMIVPCGQISYAKN